MRISALDNTATDFASDDYIALDGSVNGSRKMTKTTLLSKTTNNALAGNVSEEFDPNKPNDASGYAYYSGKNVTYEGKNYVFVVNHTSGPWDPTEVEQKPLAETIDLSGVGEAVGNWLDEHPEATTSVEDGSLTEAKFSDTLKLLTIKDYVTPEMFGAKGDGVTDDTSAFNAMFSQNPTNILLCENKTYLVGPIDVSNSATIVGGRGSIVKALDKTQTWVFRFLNRNMWLFGVTIDGAGTKSANADKGSCIGILMNSASGNTRNKLIDCIIQGCGTGVKIKNTAWNNYFYRSDFTFCENAFIIGEDSGSYLCYEFIDCNFSNSKNCFAVARSCSHVYFGRCSFSSHDDDSVWFSRSIYSCRDFVFDNCNFEEVKPDVNTAAIYAVSANTYLTFKNCAIHQVYAPDDESPTTTTSIFAQGDQSYIELENVTFSNIYVNYTINHITGNTTLKMDYLSLNSIASASGGEIKPYNVVNTTKYVITDCANVDSFPVLWDSSLNTHFYGFEVLKNRDRRFVFQADWVPSDNGLPFSIVESSNYSLTKYVTGIPNISGKKFCITTTSRVDYCTDKPAYEGDTPSYAALVEVVNCGGRCAVKWTYLKVGGVTGDYIQSYVANIRNDATSITAWTKITMT